MKKKFMESYRKEDNNLLNSSSTYSITSKDAFLHKSYSLKRSLIFSAIISTFIMTDIVTNAHAANGVESGTTDNKSAMSTPPPSDEQRKKNATKIDEITVYDEHNQIMMESGLATKSNMSLMETPAPIVIVDSQTMVSQGAEDLQDIVRNISGLAQSGNNYGVGDDLELRGLGIKYTYDGMYGGSGLGNINRSLTNVDSVEVLKGPATGLYGIGSAGGVVNLNEKKPLFEAYNEVTVKASQWDTYSLSIDTTGPINDKLAYRITAKSAESEGFRGLGTDRDEIYASIKYLINDKQDLTMSIAYIKDSIPVDSIGYPIRLFNSDSVGGKLAEEVTYEDLVNGPGGVQLTEAQRKELAATLRAGDGITPFELDGTGLISPMAQASQGEEIRLKLTHSVHFTDNLFLNQQLQYRDYDSNYVRQTGAYNYVYWNRSGTINADPRGPLVENGILYPYAGRRQDFRKQVDNEKTWQYFADLRHEFKLGSVDNELLVNANYEFRDMHRESWQIWDADYKLTDKNTGDLIYQGQVPYIYDIRNPNWASGSFDDYDPIAGGASTKTVSSYGVGIQHVAYWTKALTSRIGVAFNTIDQEYQDLGGKDSRLTNSISNPQKENDTSDKGMTYNLGLTYMPTEDFSIFANHSKGRTAYSITGSISDETSGAENRKDSESLSYDLGMRYKAFNDQLLGSLVIFQSAETNLRYGNPLYEDEVLTPGVQRYYYDGKNETTGVELDINAYINDQWKFNVNATYQDARLKNDPNSSSFNTRPKGSTFTTASAWVTYGSDWFTLQNPINISVGVHHVGERSSESTSFGIPNGYIPGYEVADLAISYETTNWKVQFNLDNITDEVYYSKAQFLGGSPGEERNISASLTYIF